MLGSVLLLTSLIPVQTALAATSGSLQNELDRLAAEYGKVETQLANTEAKQAALTKEQAEAKATIDSKAAALRARAGYMYKSGGATTMLGQLLTSADFGEFIKRIHYMGVLGGDDAQLMEQLTVAQARSSQLAEELEATEARQSRLAKNLNSQKNAVQSRLAEAKRLEDDKRKAAEAALRTQRLSAQRRTQLRGDGCRRAQGLVGRKVLQVHASRVPRPALPTPGGTPAQAAGATRVPT